MSGTVLMIGTRKGLWIAAQRRPDVVGGHRPRRRDGGGALRRLRAQRRRPDGQPRLLMGSRHWHIGPQVMHSDDLGAHLVGGTGRRGGLPGRHRGQGRGRLVPRRVGRRTGRGLRRHRAVGTVPLHRPRRDLRAGPRALGPPAPSGVAARRRRAGDPHANAAPHRPGPDARGDVGRRRLPHRRRRHVVGARQPGHQGRVHARRRPVPRVGPVRPQGRPLPAEPRRALRAEPRRGLPLRRRRRQLDVDRRRAAGRVRVPGGHAPARGRRAVAVPAGELLPALPAGPGVPGLAVERRRAAPGRSRARGCPTGASSPG